ncbi:translation initiation factor IF-2 [Saccharospirillum salsuginis]|uniref:Translation initiation factor IF-2 n=1 Tax=Saccharospirillum salsuginis TaxID=418750 RepID=A0A918N6T0_9GAMM|nr:translation initiation factor IF-2 [Saccharospirillum salsuginis]GGX44816.1 translation initiation factor IF-2 [Saccharospirillum salsuginis]
MAEVTVKQLAESVGTPVDRLLKQMSDAGLPHKAESDAVSDDQKQTLLTYLKTSHGENSGSPKKITLKRKVTTQLKTGGGGRGKTVSIEVRKKRTYVKRDAAEGAEAPSQAEPTPAADSIASRRAEEDAKLEAARQRDAEEKAREEAARKETAEKEAAEPAAAEKKAKPEAKKAKAEPEEVDPKLAVAEAEAKMAKEDRTSDKKKHKTEKPIRVDDGPAADARKAGHKKGGKRAEVAQRSATGRGGNKHQQMLSALNEGEGFGRRRRPKKGHGKKRDHQFERPTAPVVREVQLGEAITVSDLAQQMSVKAAEVVKILFKMGVMVTVNQSIDQDTAILVIEEMGHKYTIVNENAMEDDVMEVTYEGEESPRAPVVTVMGHVDHGKTSLLDHIRRTRVTAGESGGITQHIGAYHVETGKGMITFLDTPGHEAFTAMRARGAQATDVVILVVAADDGVMPQTEEAIQHAKAAGVPIIVAINKMDKEGADPDRVINELAQREVIPEDWGGDTQFVKVSAHSGLGIDELLDGVLLQSEMLELKAHYEGPGKGVVVESSLDKGRGAVATVLVQSGRLSKGDVVLAGHFYGKVRALLDETGKQVEHAGPSIPVEILGLNGTPDAGDEFVVVDSERDAREVAEMRSERSKESMQAQQQAAKLDALFQGMGSDEQKNLNVVVKADVRGSLEAINASLQKLSTDEVKVNIVASGVGAISESDANLAITAGAVVFGFNVRATGKARQVIEQAGLDLRYYNVIYDLIDDVKAAMSGLLSPDLREEIVGLAEVRDVFNSPKFGQVAGCMVIEGTVYRNKKIRVLRDEVVIYEGELESLRRYKDDVQDVRQGMECGIGVKNYNDVKAGDKIEVFDVKEVARSIDD